MSTAPLMPKATAMWLVENTSLTFEQIADFCRLHHLEVKGIADGEVAAGIKGLDPMLTGQLTREEIEKAERVAEELALQRWWAITLAAVGAGLAVVSMVPWPSFVERHYTRAARIAPTPSCGCCAIMPSSRTRRSCASSAPPSRPSSRSATAPIGTWHRCRRSIR